MNPPSVLDRVLSAVRRAWLLPVYGYRKVSPYLKPNPSCRFTPTCSAYAVEAVMTWGILLGTLLTLWRILRCNPFGKGGYDPVPTPPWKKNKDDGQAPDAQQ